MFGFVKGVLSYPEGDDYIVHTMRHQETITFPMQNGIQEETKSGTSRPVPGSHITTGNP